MSSVAAATDFDRGQRALLERIARGATLASALGDLTRLVEAQAEGLLCTVLLLDASRGTVHPIAAPSVPAAYTQSLDGRKIGPEEGSCGAAAFRRRRVIVTDIATHPYWRVYKDLALPHGLRACWSTPIFSADRDVLGTFAIYYRVPRAPTRIEEAWVDAATHLAAIAIERYRSEQERQRLAEQLEEAQRLRALGTLASGIAHDFNNIVMAIRGHTELALDDMDREQVKNSLEEVKRASLRAENLVRQILTFARQQAPQRKRVDLRPIVAEAAALLRPMLPVTASLELRLPTDPVESFADETQVHQVLMNLGANAAHAMEEREGTIEIELDSVVLDAGAACDLRAVAPGRYARLRVSDAGRGMDRQTLARVFEPFFTTKPQGVGTGLGLSVVHGIMKSHEGSIQVQSEPEKGTSIELCFPA